MQYAAHQLDKDAKQWESKDNAMVEAARKMAKLMMQMAKYARWDKPREPVQFFLVFVRMSKLVQIASW